ncbi:TetR family transcriptional regulator [Saccharibacillus sp. CPCC 101409]|uniref:TetR family transcriptional regulator n=1 Tax=Saccharibacillus sp. CPCC 101409 TaxID=3058041 RepID=UPI0026720346|nr:TetR family transcriptional regulator [Saccharibacillus sp. CPCC 101409]MDO3409752.1 TetR family transcriptional regulator [Saccharibacillus sp. CPCC 101409]
MRNAEATRELILTAAMDEFSAYGIAGARVDRIAKTAGFNKNLIYVYFENKETLFATVLQKYIDRAFDAIPFTPEDLPDYAARVFDFAMDNPKLMRLLMWSNLEQPISGRPERGEVHEQKMQQIRQAQDSGRTGSAFSPKFLLTSIMTLATAWTATNPFGSSGASDAEKDRAGLRRSIAETVELMVRAEAGKPRP